jgi:hypothetical protein
VEDFLHAVEEFVGDVSDAFDAHDGLSMMA